MRRFLIVAFLLASACDTYKLPRDQDGGGGLTIDNFGDRFVSKYCTAWANCEMGGDCPVSNNDDDDDAECDFDRDAAQQCLDAEFSCGDFGPELPTVCGTICQ